mmetsp:Transcript_1609/g.4788  ORF Transcript_1609/g.4788 Transcript_1609/m.4788 type:complete len:232 (+) Transcript_1609:84-779(+)
MHNTTWRSRHTRKNKVATESNNERHVRLGVVLLREAAAAEDDGHEVGFVAAVAADEAEAGGAGVDGEDVDEEGVGEAEEDEGDGDVGVGVALGCVALAALGVLLLVREQRQEGEGGEGEDVRQREAGGDGGAEVLRVGLVVAGVAEGGPEEAEDLVRESLGDGGSEVRDRRQEAVHETLGAGLAHFDDDERRNDEVGGGRDLGDEDLAQEEVLVPHDVEDRQVREGHVQDV